MKALIVWMSLVVVAGVSWARDSKPSVRQPAASKSVAVSMVTNRFALTGMHCTGCAGGIASELKRTRGVKSASVDFPKALAVVGYDTNRVSAQALVKVVEEAGYGAKLLP